VNQREDALAALWRAVDAYDQSNFRVDAAVRRARGCGATWEEIGLALGVSRRAAGNRYALPDREASTASV
jgi:hypothetical protein